MNPHVLTISLRELVKKAPAGGYFHHAEISALRTPNTATGEFTLSLPSGNYIVSLVKTPA